MVAAAVSCPALEVSRVLAIEGLDNLGTDAAESGAGRVDTALARGLVKIDAPAVRTYQGHVLGHLRLVEVVTEEGALARLQVATGTALLDTFPLLLQS